MDLLRDPELEVERLIMPTNVDGLSLLPSGTRGENAAELLASARMESVCAYLSASDAQRMVVFDSSPLLYTTEAPVLASQVGQVALVVHADKTPQQDVLAALDKLEQTKAINLILNQASSGEAVARYGSYYGYGDSVSN